MHILFYISKWKTLVDCTGPYRFKCLWKEIKWPLNIELCPTQYCLMILWKFYINLMPLHQKRNRSGRTISPEIDLAQMSKISALVEVSHPLLSNWTLLTKLGVKFFILFWLYYVLQPNLVQATQFSDLLWWSTEWSPINNYHTITLDLNCFRCFILIEVRNTWKSNKSTMETIAFR